MRHFEDVAPYLLMGVMLVILAMMVGAGVWDGYQDAERLRECGVACGPGRMVTSEPQCICAEAGAR